MLKLRNINKVVNNKTILANINLNIYDNDFLCVVANEEQSKMICSLLVGFNKPTFGEILLNEEDITDIRPSDRRIALVSKNMSLKKNLTVYDNIAYELRSKKIKEEKVEIIVDDVIEKLNLDVIKSCVPDEISKYQMLIVSLVRATLFQPQLLILEDPLSLISENKFEDFLTYLKLIRDYLNGAGILYLGRKLNQANKIAKIDESGELSEFGSIGIVETCGNTLREVILSASMDGKKLSYNDESILLSDIFLKRIIVNKPIEYIKLYANLFTIRDTGSDLKFEIVDKEINDKTIIFKLKGFQITRDYHLKLDSIKYLYYPRNQLILLDENKQRLNSHIELIQSSIKIKIRNISLGLFETGESTYKFSGVLDKTIDHLTINRNKIYQFSNDRRSSLIIQRIISVEEFEKFNFVTFMVKNNDNPISLMIEKNESSFSKEKSFIKMNSEDFLLPLSSFTKR